MRSTRRCNVSVDRLAAKHMVALRARGADMRSVADYLHKATEFDALAARVDIPVPLKNRYADLAESYRLLAKERERMIAQGAVLPDDPPQSN